jgi:XTP/dITP diphosphohydrolase
MDCFLGYREKDKIYVFKGEVVGKIVLSRGNAGFGFDPYFLPEGSKKTLAEEKPAHFNARALVVKAFVEKKTFIICSPIYRWNGEWQKH